MTTQEHVSEAIAALGQYLVCLRGGKEAGWGDECGRELREVQDHTRQAMIAATPCPGCGRAGCNTHHGRAL